ncbi:class I lanthipeptide [Flavobacterium hydatis]|uniref:class I lanthipeptide n=1 Tax=Flavobacterium hydatis TaxID=991 RepID=UPI001969EC62
MKRQNTINKLAFNKVAVIELNDTKMHDVEGGSTPLVLPSTIIITVLSCDL